MPLLPTCKELASHISSAPPLSSHSHRSDALTMEQVQWDGAVFHIKTSRQHKPAQEIGKKPQQHNPPLSVLHLSWEPKSGNTLLPQPSHCYSALNGDLVISLNLLTSTLFSPGPTVLPCSTGAAAKPEQGSDSLCVCRTLGAARFTPALCSTENLQPAQEVPCSPLHPETSSPACPQPATLPPAVSPHLLSPRHLHPGLHCKVCLQSKGRAGSAVPSHPLLHQHLLKDHEPQGSAKATRSPQADALFLCSVLWAV